MILPWKRTGILLVTREEAARYTIDQILAPALVPGDDLLPWTSGR